MQFELRASQRSVRMCASDRNNNKVRSDRNCADQIPFQKWNEVRDGAHRSRSGSRSGHNIRKDMARAPVSRDPLPGPSSRRRSRMQLGRRKKFSARSLSPVCVLARLTSLSSFCNRRFAFAAAAPSFAITLVCNRCTTSRRQSCRAPTDIVTFMRRCDALAKLVSKSGNLFT